MKIRFYILFVLLCLLSKTDICAQIQPPLGTAISWTQVQYASIDSLLQDYKIKNGELSIKDSIGHEICNGIRSLLVNFKQYNVYNDSIFIPTFRDDWAEMIRRRAEYESTMYGKNQSEINKIEGYFKSGVELPKSSYDSLLHCTHMLYRMRTEDFFLINDFMKILLPFYEKYANDKERLMLCYIMAGYCDFQISRLDGDESRSVRSQEDYQKVIDLFPANEKFQSQITPFYVLCAYCNTMLTYVMRKHISIERSYEIRKQFDVYYNKNSKQFDKIPNLRNYYNWICNLYDLKMPIICIEQEQVNSDIFKTLYKNYNRCIKSVSQDQLLAFMNINYSDMLIDKWFIQASLGEINPSTAFLSSHDRIIYNLQDVTDIDLSRRDRNIQYLYNTIVTSIGLLELTNYSDKEKHDYLIDYLEILSKFISLYPQERLITLRSDIERRIMTLPYITKYLTTDEQINYLKKFILYEQPQTFAHVTMVSKLCDAIIDYVINYKPELLHDVPGCATRMDVWMHEKELKDFVHNSAIFHDLGKNIIPSVVNNSFRKLTDEEFYLIRKHPELSGTFMTLNPKLYSYHDISFGHHKWYDGKGGYPKSFDNVASPYRILIDILTISDCTDAATDNYGRNYHHFKRFRQILAELDSQAGTRYNPDIIKLIHDEPALYNRLSEIVDEKRMDAYYDIYKQYFR